MSLDRAVAIEVLAGEHAAVYGYGVLAARLAGAPRQQALRGLDVHRARRDELRRLILAAGGIPVESEPAYALPTALTGPAAALALGTALETDIALAYGALVAASSAAERAFAAAALADAAVRVSEWSGQAPRLPGIPAPVDAAARATATPRREPAP
ncbi:MAG: ferritin-like domain-containing protein [Sporichthyaceae bacterium]